MSQYVREIMCEKLFHCSEDEPYISALLGILSLGISGAPVLDEAGMPVGVISLRDLVGERRAPTVGGRMTSPAVVISRDATVEDAGRMLATRSIHRLVVVDGDGCAVGVVSALDLVRALIGLPARHPAALVGESTGGLTWSDPAVLSEENAQVVPQQSGLLMLVHGGAGTPEVEVWAESASDLRERILSLSRADNERADPPQLTYLLQRESEHLRFRTARVDDPRQRVDALLEARRQMAND